MKVGRYAIVFHRDFSHRSAHEWKDWSTWQRILARAYGQGYFRPTRPSGTSLEALRDSGQEENTLVIWCADHGDAVASHGGMWDKASTFIEEVARVPMAMRWPAGMGSRLQTDRLVSNLDVTATMLDAAGVAIPDVMHSRSLLPLCREPDRSDWSNHLICQHHGHNIEMTQRICISGQYKYVAALFDGDELYDLEDDPFETHNLIDSPEHQEPRKRLRAYIIEHIEETADPLARHLVHALKLGW